MSFKFLAMNSRCTIIEVAILVDGLLKNVLAQHLSDMLEILCGNNYSRFQILKNTIIYSRFQILKNTIIYENTSRNQFLKLDGEYEQRQS
jgi:hypothetical protein